MNNLNKQAGFSMIELLLVIIIVIVLSVLALQKVYQDKSEVGGSEKLLALISARINERREDAVRLNSEAVGTLTNVAAQPLPINLAIKNETGSLVILGDNNGDCLDDFDNTQVTCLQSSGNWQLVFRQDPLDLPPSWELVQNRIDLGDIPTIGNGNNQGVLVSKIGFDQDGRAFGFIDGNWLNSPASNNSTNPSESPFWAVYFVTENKKQAIAFAIHPSGLIEKFRFNGTVWRGFANREL